MGCGLAPLGFMTDISKTRLHGRRSLTHCLKTWLAVSDTWLLHSIARSRRSNSTATCFLRAGTSEASAM